jgi:hypothetical protein
MLSRTLPLFKAFKFKSSFISFYLTYHITNLYLQTAYDINDDLCSNLDPCIVEHSTAES